MNILFFIPARGGSKGIPKKNLAGICGCPLIAFPIMNARRSLKYLKEYNSMIFLSTDSKEIAKVGMDWGAKVPFLRKKNLAGDRSDIIDAILYSCEKLKKEKIFEPETIVLLQPTSPLTEPENIKNAFGIYLKEKKSVISISKYDHPLSWIFNVKNDYLKINKKIPHLRQKEKNKYFRPNGAIYISSLENLKKYKTFYQKNTIGYEMDFYNSIDIDKLEDLYIAEKMLEVRTEINRNDIKIGNRIIGKGFPVFFIAEAGVNHNGNLEIAKKLVDVAKDSGADCIKFQTFKAEELVSKNAKKAKYQLETTDKNESQLEMLKKLELSEKDFIELKEYCDKRKILFLSTPFDLRSLELLEKIEVPAYKIGSGNITDYFLLKECAKNGKPIILSTGMSELYEVFDAINLIESYGNRNILLLHCLSEYPARIDEANLMAIKNMSLLFNIPCGFSDHTEGFIAGILAVSFGASIIEKHFTLDKNMEGPDHKASLEPEELKKFIESIRSAEKAIGDGIKKIQSCEKENRFIVRKSLYAKREIKKGEILYEEALIALRPGDGISPMKIDFLVGKRAKKNIKKGEILKFEYLEE